MKVAIHIPQSKLKSDVLAARLDYKCQTKKSRDPCLQYEWATKGSDLLDASGNRKYALTN